MEERMMNGREDSEWKRGWWMEERIVNGRKNDERKKEWLMLQRIMIVTKNEGCNSKWHKIVYVTDGTMLNVTENYDCYKEWRL